MSNIFYSYKFKNPDPLVLSVPDKTIKELRSHTFSLDRVRLSFPAGIDQKLIEILTNLGFDKWVHSINYNAQLHTLSRAYIYHAATLTSVELVYKTDRDIAIRMNATENIHKNFSELVGLKANPKSKSKPKRAEIFYDMFGEQIFEGSGVVVPVGNELFLGQVVSWTMKTIKVKLHSANKRAGEKNFGPKSICVIEPEKYTMALLRS